VANINRQIAEELGVREQQVEATVALLDGGATVPFVARYRKEVTGALDDAQLRTLEERLNYLRELEERRTAILNSVREQGKLDAALEAAILAADSKGRLEDIYLPFKPKRRTKAEIAKEAGLEPLSELLLAQPQNDPLVVAAGFVDVTKQVADVAAALEGARAILVSFGFVFGGVAKGCNGCGAISGMSGQQACIQSIIVLIGIKIDGAHVLQQPFLLGGRRGQQIERPEQRQCRRLMTGNDHRRHLVAQLRA